MTHLSPRLPGPVDDPRQRAALGGAGPVTRAGGVGAPLALTPLGQALAWGRNDRGQLGDGSTTQRVNPVHVMLPDGTPLIATALTAGEFHSLAIAQDGHVYAWGYNTNGQLGDGSHTQRVNPVHVMLPDGTPLIATALTAGEFHSLAIAQNGHVYAWGRNDRGQLGDGTATDRVNPVPVRLAGGTPLIATALTAGWGHSLAIVQDGHVYAWGYNSNGQLGDGSHTQRVNPVPVMLPDGTPLIATALTARGFHSLAIVQDGHVYAWGYNGNGQLGDGTTTDRVNPVPVVLAGGTPLIATALTAGEFHSLALTLDGHGHVYAWGVNSAGQLGDGSHTQRVNPVHVMLPDGTPLTATALTAGFYHSLAIGNPVTETTLASSVNPSTYGQLVTFTAMVTSPAGGTPTGTVTFTDTTGTLLETATVDASGQASIATSGLTAGSHEITATYNGDANYTGSASSLTQIVDKATTVVDVAFRPL